MTNPGNIGLDYCVEIALIDHFGWLGVPQVRLNPWQIAGAILLFFAALMMQKR